jgi:hypothetical protein
VTLPDPTPTWRGTAARRRHRDSQRRPCYVFANATRQAIDFISAQLTGASIQGSRGKRQG